MASYNCCLFSCPGPFRKTLESESITRTDQRSGLRITTLHATFHNMKSVAFTGKRKEIESKR
jgi:hypothetical protein